jgi:zinc transport system substrate-binding protein
MVEVSEMIPPGFSPTTYNPSPEQLKKLQIAAIYFRIGHIPFEKAQMGKLEQINPAMKVVDTSEGISLLSSKTDEHRNDEEREEKSELSDDPHIWLSPKLVKIQAEHIYNALIESRPENKDYFLANYRNFIEDLNQLDVDLDKTFAPVKGKIILVFHPSFGYLADAYGFKQEAVEVEGKEPSPENLKKIIDRAQSRGIKVIFVQKQFSAKSAEAVAKEIGGSVVQIDPLAENYFENLKLMSSKIIEGME